MPWHAVFGNRLAATLIRWLYGISLTDLGPFRAARSEVLRALDLREMTYGWAVELMTRGARRGYRVMEVPVSYHPRIGVSKISGTWRGSIGAAWYILTGIVKNRLGSATAPVRAGTSRHEARGAVVVMAKAPREGFVKTRLTGAYPASDVVQLADCMLRDTLALVQTAPWRPRGRDVPH